DLWLCLPLFAVFALYTAIPLAAWALLLSSWTGPSRHVPWVAAVALPGLWSAWPAVFPFTPAMGLAARPQWIQAAELGGAALVEALVVLCGALAAEAVRAQGRARLGLAAAAVALPLASYALGDWRMQAL